MAQKKVQCKLCVVIDDDSAPAPAPAQASAPELGVDDHFLSASSHTLPIVPVFSTNNDVSASTKTVVALKKKCSRCRGLFPDSDYSGAQLKAKGGRQCKTCVTKRGLPNDAAAKFITNMAAIANGVENIDIVTHANSRAKLLPFIIRSLHSLSETIQLRSVVELRDIFADCNNEVRQSAVDAGVIVHLLQLVRQSNSALVQLECGKCLSLLSLSRNTVIDSAFMSSGVLQTLAASILAAKVDTAIQEQYLWILTNLSEQQAHRPDHRRDVLDTGILPALLSLVVSDSSVIGINASVGQLLRQFLTGAPVLHWSELSVIVRASAVILQRIPIQDIATVDSLLQVRLICDCLFVQRVAIELPLCKSKNSHNDNGINNSHTEHNSNSSHDDSRHAMQCDVHNSDNTLIQCCCSRCRIDYILHIESHLLTCVQSLLKHPGSAVVGLVLQLLTVVLKHCSLETQLTLSYDRMLKYIAPLLSHEQSDVRIQCCVLLEKIVSQCRRHAMIVVSHKKVTTKVVKILTAEVDIDVRMHACRVLAAVAQYAHQHDNSACDDEISGTTVKTTTTINTKEESAVPTDKFHTESSFTTLDFVRTLVDTYKVIPALVSMLCDSFKSGHHGLLYVATQALGHVLDAGVLESELDERGINPYIEPIDWLGAFEIWSTLRNDDTHTELSREAGRLFDLFFIPNTCE